MTDVYRALAHPSRRDILSALTKKPLSAGEIAERLKIAKPTLSGHLNILKEADLVDVERRGVTLIYRVNVSVAEETAANLMSLFRIGKKSSPMTRAVKGRA